LKIIAVIKKAYNIDTINFFEMYFDISLNLIKQKIDYRKIT